MLAGCCARPLGRGIRSLSGESLRPSPKRLWSRAKNGSARCSKTFWRAKLRSETAYRPRGHSLSALRSLPGPARGPVGPSEGAKVRGTGHSRMELLCPVLAEGVSAPSARKYAETEIWSKFHTKMHKAPRMASGPALEAARGALAWRRLCEARSSGEQGVEGAGQWRERRGGGREGRGSTDSGHAWWRWN